MDADAPVIRIAAAVRRDGGGRTLLVRKQGAAVFQQPGGKRDPGDADDQASLARELREELGCELQPGSARLLCHAVAAAANVPGHRVEAAVDTVVVRGQPAAQAEVAELRWVDPAATGELPIAALSPEHILPLLAQAAQGRRAPSVTSRVGAHAQPASPCGRGLAAAA